MTRCKTCGSVLRDHRDPARTQLQAFAEACPEVVRALTIALDRWYLRACCGGVDLDTDSSTNGWQYREARALLRRMTATATEEK